MSNGKIDVFLVEDNPGDARLVKEMLTEVKGTPFRLACAQRLQEGVERLDGERVDVILLDLSLPDSHGYETFVRMLAAAPDIPIVVMSGLDDETLAVRAVREGAQDYLIKGQADANLLARAIRYAIERKEAEAERERLIAELQDAMAKIKMLQGLLPICASCKRIRDDKGYWNQIELYISEHSEAEFTHGICPECLEKLYPDYVNKMKG
ncbi:MAG TPA: response regulator [Geobacteraceae bacterium]